jgi:hypothetical protein
MMTGAASAQQRKPWEVDPVLKPRRLALLAQVAIETRNRAFAEADREQGDTNWGLGCKAHERFRHALFQLAQGAESPWLRVQREGLSFSVLVESTPIRVYRGSSLRPPMHYVRSMAVEAQAIDERQLGLFGDVTPSPPSFWMMAIETHDDGRVRRTVFFSVDEAGQARHHWEPTEGGLFGDDPEELPAKKRNKPRVELAADRTLSLL